MTISKVPLRSSWSRDTVLPSFHNVCTVSVTTWIASSVERCLQFPIYPSGKRPAASTLLASRSPISASITFPMQLSSEIGLQAPACHYYYSVLPGFHRTTTYIDLKQCRKCSSRKLSSTMLAIAWQNSRPHALRNPV